MTDPTLLLSLAAADPAPPPMDWTAIVALIGVVLGGLGVLLGGLSTVLHAIAPRTKTTVDDKLAANVDAAHAKLDALLGIVSELAPKAVTKAALVLLLALGAGATMTACATTSATLKTEATTLEGCSAADAVAIVTASAKIVDDVKATDHVTAAIDAIGQLATIHAAWSRCKGAAPPTVPAPRPATAALTLRRELLFCGNGCMSSSTCSEGAACSKCVGNTCTTETPLTPEPEQVAYRSRCHARAGFEPATSTPIVGPPGGVTSPRLVVGGTYCWTSALPLSYRT